MSALETTRKESALIILFSIGHAFHCVLLADFEDDHPGVVLRLSAVAGVG
jgi:hypothetical protein